MKSSLEITHDALAERLPSEEIRNRVLRRADWRFLLPNPSPTRTLSLSDGLLREAISAISRVTVTPEEQASGECDLAVVADPDAARLGAALDALAPGGYCYCEWRPRRSVVRGARRARAALEAAGFEDVRCYWAWPHPARGLTQFWLPLDAPEAQDYLLTHRPSEGSRTRRFLQATRRRMWSTAARLDLVPPSCAVARKPSFPLDDAEATSDGRPAADSSFSSLVTATGVAKMVGSSWHDRPLDRRPDARSWLLLTGGPRSISKVVGLVFSDGERQPQAAVKMARVPEAETSLVREAAMLRAIHALSPNGVPGVPRLLWSRLDTGAVTLVESVLSGEAIRTVLRQDNYRDLALTATHWLVRLAGESRQEFGGSVAGRIIDAALADFRANFGSVVDSDLLSRSETAVSRLKDLTLPIVCEHRDFSPWNVLRAPDGELAVLDWEGAELQGLPALDLIYFLAHLTFFYDRATETVAQQRDSYRRLLDGSATTGNVVCECLTSYAERVGLATDLLPALRLLTWLIHARSEYRRLTADASGQPSHEALRDSLFVALWEEELIHGS